MIVAFTSLTGSKLSLLQAEQLPNVIVVLADDLGIGDITATNPNCKIKTPELQKIAEAGMIFRDAHTPSSVCTPTRYGLLTGRYNWRSRLAKGVLSGTSEHLIPADRPTLGHLMKSRGYQTAMIGKWHLGWDWGKTNGEIDFTKPVKNGPDINGFDRYYGHSGSLDMPPYVWVDTGRVTAQPDREDGVTKKENPYGWYRQGPIAPDFKIDQVLPHLFDKSIEYINQQSGNPTPFFLYLALPAPHTPIVPLSPFKDASGLNPYADFVMQVDYEMGRLMNALQQAGISETTLLVFTSDNGCSPEANFKELREHDHDPSGGFRGHKADLYEGGHRVPFLVRWPGKIQPNSSSDSLVCLTDIYSTLHEITQAAGVNKNEHTNGGEDSFSFLPVLLGNETSARSTLVSHSIDGKFAIRQGNWKLCVAPGSGGWSAPTDTAATKQKLPSMQLFNLKSDPKESTNLMESEPARVEALLKLLASEVDLGRSTPGEPQSNDRPISFLPETDSGTSKK